MGVSDANTSESVKFYLRLPAKIVDEEEVRDLHPGILKVTLPRQKSRRWCVVEFDRATAKSAVQTLRSVKVDGKKVMMGAGGFRKNPGWEFLGDDIMLEDEDDVIPVETFLNGDEEDFDLDISSQAMLLFSPSDDELDEEDNFDDIFNPEEDDEDDDDYFPSDSLDEEDFDDDDTIIMPSDDSAPELST